VKNYRPRGEGARTRLSRLAPAGVLTVALGLGVAACGGTLSAGTGGPASPLAGSTGPAGTGLPTTLPPAVSRYLKAATPQDRAAFTQCMRGSGVPGFPSSFTLAALQAAGIDVRSASFLAAARACKSKLLG